MIEVLLPVIGFILPFRGIVFLAGRFVFRNVDGELGTDKLAQVACNAPVFLDNYRGMVSLGIEFFG
jgi:hypothetical protein